MPPFTLVLSAGMILSAKIKNLKALGIRSISQNLYETEGFSSFHRVESVLFVSTTFSSFYHNFITAESMQKGVVSRFRYVLIVCKHTCCGFGK